MSQKRQKDDMSSGNWRPAAPYNDLPPLPPAGVELDSKPILRRCISARAALAELKQAAELIPNQAILINTLPLLEARASSEVENIVTTNDRLFRFRSTDEHADPATREALRYSRALLEGFRTLVRRPFTTSTAETICTTIKGVQMSVRKVPGTKLENAAHEVIYTPPEGVDRLRAMLANWERFMHDRQHLDPLIRMAVGHYQFEAIHPFTDGNGRTGRVLNSLFLIHEGLLSMPILYLSRHIIEHKSDYYRLLLNVTADRTWTEWIEYMLVAVEQTARWTTERISAMRQLFDATADFVRRERPQIYSHELINQIFEQPYCRIQNIVDANIVERQAASRYLKQLAAMGVLEERKFGREKLFLHPRLLNLLTRDAVGFEPYE